MIAAVLDTTVILHLFRKYQPALNWFNNQQTYGVTSITWLEVMEGASNKANQTQCKTLLEQYEILHSLRQTSSGQCSSWSNSNLAIISAKRIA